MASYYDKILSSNKKSVPKHSKKLITLDDSIADEDQKPNIFNDDPKPVQKIQQNNKKPIVKPKQSAGKAAEPEKRLETKNKKQNLEKSQQKQKKASVPQKQRKAPQQKLEYMNNEEIQDNEHSLEEPEVHGVSKKSWLSVLESINLSLGHFLYTYNFPIRREIPIIANNLDLEREKYDNGTYISESFDNNLQISFLLFFLRAVLIENFFRISVIMWIIAIVLSFLIGSNEQYRPGKQILLGIFVFYCVVVLILQFLALRHRRNWRQPGSKIKYKVYHFNNETRQGQWVLTDVAGLRPGNIYKVPPPTLATPSVIPADSVLLHGPRTILQVDQSQVVEYLSPLEKQERISLKQTLIKTDVIMLPLTGVVHYELAAPEVLQQNIYGRFTQQQPQQETFSISYNNVVVRGTKILSSEILLADDSDRRIEEKQSQVLAVVLETGIDSLVLKTSQYPYQYRSGQYFVTLIDTILIICSLLYLLIVGAGILIGYIYLANDSISHGYYIDTYLDLGERPIHLAEIVLHHFGNLVMLVPLLLRVVYLLFVACSAKIIGKKIGVKIKDFNMIAEARETDVLVTTIGSDLIRMGSTNSSNPDQQPSSQPQANIFESIEEGRATIRNRSLQSIRVSGIHHNFLTTRIDNELYSVKDVDMICYFMSIALLTCNRKSPTPLEGGIIERCNKELNVKIEKQGNAIKIGQLRVIKIFTIPPTQRFPYKVVFYRHGKEIVQDLENTKQEFKEKVLCLIRGDTTKLSGKISEVDGHLLSEFSSRLHQQKGYHIELLGKFVLSYEDFLEVKRAYMSSELANENQSMVRNEESRASSAGKRYKLGINKFYGNLDRYMLKVDPMGLLIWQNPYSVLSSDLLPISSLPQPTYKIIIAPASKSQLNPQFESIHSITNYLLRTSKLSLKEISKKILHTYTNKETFWAQLSSEKILVLNGWDYRMIRKMLTDLKEINRANKRPIKFLSYIEQDQYAWVLKESTVSISTRGDGHDLQKYSDILIDSSSSCTTTETIRKLFLYSQAYSYCIKSIIVLQFMKSVMLATIEFINLFYTWGTGLAIIGSPLYLILEIGVLADFVYYLFPRIGQEITGGATQDASNRRSKGKSQEQSAYAYQLKAQNIMLQFFVAVLLGCLTTFIPIYSMTEPPTVNGTVQPKVFTNLLIHFILYHIVVLRKPFLQPYTLSAFKALVLAIQMGTYYLGILIISAIDEQYRGVIWFMIQGKMIVIGVFVVWMALGLFWLAFMLHNLIYPRAKLVPNHYERVKPDKNDEEIGADQRDIKVGEPVDIE